jgi:hypothetical protein
MYSFSMASTWWFLCLYHGGVIRFPEYTKWAFSSLFLDVAHHVILSTMLDHFGMFFEVYYCFLLHLEVWMGNKTFTSAGLNLTFAVFWYRNEQKWLFFQLIQCYCFPCSPEYNVLPLWNGDWSIILISIASGSLMGSRK